MDEQMQEMMRDATRKSAEFARQDREKAWHDYMELLTSVTQRHPDKAPFDVYAFNLHEAHELWWQAHQRHQQIRAEMEEWLEAE